MLFKVRPSEIARWPAWELDLLDHYISREPAPIVRVEVAIARLTQIFAAVHRDKNSQSPKLVDFMPYLKAWPEEDESGRYNEIDREIMKVML